MNRAWLAPFGCLYGLAVSVRNKLFDWKFIRSQEYDIPVVCVGNITVGGTGKTPLTEFLVERLKAEWKLAVLSRGYRRKTKGYLEVEAGTSFLNCGDEPKQIKLKFGDVTVAVCEDRREGIRLIRERHPEINLIIMDDGFQHRYVEPWVNIVVMNYNRPIYRDHPLPWGTLRDNVSQLHRAHYVVVTNCPQDMTPLERRLVTKSLSLYPYQELFFTGIRNTSPAALFEEGNAATVKDGADVVAMCGIGNPASFTESLGARYNVVGTLIYPDHHPYRRRDLRDMEAALDSSPQGTVILTTEKDAVKLRGSRKIPPEIREKLFYIPLEIIFNENSGTDFINKLKNNVRTNPKHSFLHP